MPTVQFFLTSLVVILIPGTGVVYTITTGLARGSRRAVVAAIGCTLGIVPHLAAGVFGLSAVLHMSSLAFRILKIAGTVYLLYLAWSLWRSSGTFDVGSDRTPASGWRIIGRAILINLLNPKLTLFFFAFLPQFLPPSGLRPSADISILGLLFMLMTLVVFIGYGLLAASVSRLLEQRPALPGIVQKGFSGLIAVFALKLAFAADE